MNKRVLIGIIIMIIVVITGVVLFVNMGGEKTDNKNISKQIENEEENTNCKVTYGSVNVTPGKEFNVDEIAEEGVMSQIPSRAFDGTDNVYTYSDIEITTTNIQGVEKVYSVNFLNDIIETEEKVKISDEKDKMIEAYGNDYKNDNTKYIYTKGDVELSFIIKNDIITNIEYIYKYE